MTTSQKFSMLLFFFLSLSSMRASDYPAAYDAVYCFQGQITAAGNFTGDRTVSSVQTSLDDYCVVESNGMGTGAWYATCPSINMEGGSDYSMTVTLSDSSESELEFTCSERPTGDVSASTSTVVASPTSVPGDLVTPATLTVTLLDADSLPVSGKMVSLSSTGTMNSISSNLTPTDAQGQVTFETRGWGEGSATFTATNTTDDITVTQTATVTFTAP